jgi:transcriptional regulator with XRE-family HTH domain
MVTKMIKTKRCSQERMLQIDNLISSLIEVLKTQKEVLGYTTNVAYAKRAEVDANTLSKLLNDNDATITVYRLMEILMRCGVSFTIVPKLAEDLKGKATVSFIKYNEDIKKRQEKQNNK